MVEWPMAFIRIRTINGKEYRYEEHRWRGADGKVKSRSIYLGPASGRSGGGLSIFPKPISPEQRGLRYIERMMDRDAAASQSVKVSAWTKASRPTAEQRMMAEGDRLARERADAVATAQKARELFKESTGLSLPVTPDAPTPIDKTSPETTEVCESATKGETDAGK